MKILDELKKMVTPGAAVEAAAGPAVADAPAPVAASTEAVPVPVDAPAVTVALDDNGEPFEYDADPEQERREDLPMRSRQRIGFLLRTYEAGHPERTAARIANDRARYLSRKPQIVTDRKQTTNPQSVLVDATRETPSVGTWTR